MASASRAAGGGGGTTQPRARRPVSFSYALKLALRRDDIAPHANHDSVADYAKGMLVRIRAAAKQYRLYTVDGRAPDATGPYKANATSACAVHARCTRGAGVDDVCRPRACAGRLLLQGARAWGGGGWVGTLVACVHAPLLLSHGTGVA